MTSTLSKKNLALVLLHNDWIFAMAALKSDLEAVSFPFIRKTLMKCQKSLDFYYFHILSKSIRAKKDI
jgi:hypothetical protein